MGEKVISKARVKGEKYYKIYHGFRGFVSENHIVEVPTRMSNFNCQWCIHHVRKQLSISQHCYVAWKIFQTVERNGMFDKFCCATFLQRKMIRSCIVYLWSYIVNTLSQKHNVLSGCTFQKIEKTRLETV